MKFFTRIPFFFLVFCFASTLSGQVINYTFSSDKSSIAINVKNDKPEPPLKLEEDRKLGLPLKIGQKFDLSIDNRDVGIWQSLPEGNVWTFEIKAVDSKGLILNFDDFYIPQGAHLYVYESPDDAQPLLFTHSNNPEGGAYSMEVYSSDRMILKYVEPSDDITEVPRFKISSFGYKNGGMTLSGLNRSGSCMVNINCDLGDDWQEQKKGVVRMRTNLRGIYYLCTGTLMNNTEEDRTPYILTASHCFEDKEYRGAAKDIAETEFFFDYEFSGCGNEIQHPAYNYIKGADSLIVSSISGGTDAALIKISKPIPDTWEVYYNGWNNETRNNVIEGGAVIHHPSGDVKKISFFEDALYTDTWEGSLSAAHWVAKYSKGSTEEGSSGGPLFDKSGLVVGSLTGGYASCSDINASDLYSKLGYSIDLMPDVNQRFRRFLDPNNTRVKKLNGWNGSKKELSLGTNILSLDFEEVAKVSITSGNKPYSVVSSDGQIVSVKIDETDGSKIVATAGKTAGEATIKVTDSKGEESEIKVTVFNAKTNADAPDIFVAWRENAADSSGNNYLYVRSKASDDLIKKIRVVNLRGNVIYEKSSGFSSNRYEVDTYNWTSGLLYIVTVDSKKTSRTYKIVK